MNYSIYVIKNLINQKVYIGRTYKNVHHRFREHLTSIHRSVAGCRHLVNAIKTYGKHNFYVEFLCCTENEETSFDLEKFFIKQFDSIKNGYNLLDGGRQFRHSDETISRISESMMGKNAGTNNPFYGKKHTDETRSKISAINTGRVGCMTNKHHTDETRRKISEGNSGTNNGNTPLTEDDVRNIKQFLADGGKQVEMVRKYSVSKTLISNIANGKTWASVSI